MRCEHVMYGRRGYSERSAVLRETRKRHTGAAQGVHSYSAFFERLRLNVLCAGAGV